MMASGSLKTPGSRPSLPRLFVRLPNEVHTKICNYDPDQLPTLKALSVAVASKLKVKPGMSYQLLLNNTAVVEHVSELRDGDTVVLQVTEKPSSTRTSSPVVEEQEVLSSHNHRHQQQPDVVGSGRSVSRRTSARRNSGMSRVASAATANENQDSTTRNEEATEGDKKTSVASSSSKSNSDPEATSESVAAKSNSTGRANTRNQNKPKASSRKKKSQACTIATSSGLSLEEELALATPNAKNGGVDDDNTPTSVDSTKSIIASIAVQAAAAAVQNMDEDTSGSGEEDSVDEDDPVVVKTVKASGGIKTTKLPKRKRSKGSTKPGTTEDDKENAKNAVARGGKKRKSVVFQDDATAAAAAAQPNSEKVTTTEAEEENQQKLPPFELNKRYFVPHFDGHYYPARIIGVPSRDVRLVQWEETNITKEFPVGELREETEELKSQWLFHKSSSAVSVCSVSSRSTRSTRASTRSLEMKKFGPLTNARLVKGLRNEMNAAGIQDKAIRGRWLPDMNRIVYFALDDETPRIIADKFPRVSLGKLIFDNQQVFGDTFVEDARLLPLSPIILPRTWHGRMVVNTINTSNPNMIQYTRTRKRSARKTIVKKEPDDSA